MDEVDEVGEVCSGNDVQRSSYYESTRGKYYESTVRVQIVGSLGDCSPTPVLIYHRGGVQGNAGEGSLSRGERSLSTGERSLSTGEPSLSR
jgi:hypothetical protein